MSNILLAKKCVKEHGVKGFRKLKLKRETYVIGRQCAYLNKFVVQNMIKRLEKLGFEVQQKRVCFELAEKGQLDTLTIQPQ